MTAMAASNNSDPRARTQGLEAHDLSYQEMTIGPNGSVMTAAEKVTLREKYGYCKECTGTPVLLYEPQRGRINFFTNRKTREIPGECSGGVCYVCHPERNPDKPRHGHGGRGRYSTADQEFFNGVGGSGGASAGSAPFTGSGGSGSAPFTGSNQTPPSPAPGRRTSRIYQQQHHHRRGSSGVGNHSAGGRSNSSHDYSMAEDFDDVITATVTAVTSSSAGSQQDANPAPAAAATSRGSNSRPAFTGVFVPEYQAQEIAFQPPIEEAAEDTPLDNIQNFPTNPNLINDTASPFLGRRRPAEDAEELSAVGDLPTSFPDRTILVRQNSTGDVSCITMGSQFQGMGQPSVSVFNSSLPDESSSTPESKAAAAAKPPPMAFEPIEEIQRETGEEIQGETDEEMKQRAKEEMKPQPKLSDSEIADVIKECDMLLGSMEGCAEFLAQILLGTMRQHTHVPQIQEYCLHKMWELCRDENANKHAFMLEKAPDDIIQILSKYPHDSTIQERGCRLIWSLSVFDENRVIMVQGGACEAVIHALRTFIATESLVTCAIGTLRVLSLEDAARQIFKARHIQAPEVVSKAMCVHRSIMPIQRDACAFLSNCSIISLEKTQVAVVPFEELDAVVQAMANHRFDAFVMTGACFALKNYTFENENCRTLRRVSNVYDMIEYASTFEASVDCMDNAFEVLERMQISKSVDESLEDQADSSLQHITECNGAVDFMRNYNWSARLIGSSMRKLSGIIGDDQDQSSSKTRNQRTINFLFDQDGRMLREIFKFCQPYVDKDELICQQLCQFLVRLSGMSTDSQLNLIVEAGGCALIFQCLGFTRSEGVVNSALEALKHFTSHAEFFTALKENLNLVMEVMSMHSGDESIQLNGIALVSSLDHQ